MAKSHKLDIFNLLERIDGRQKSYYSKLSDEEKSSISMWLLTRWISSSKNMPEHHLLMVNDIVNDEASSLSKHPELQWKLLCVCGTGKKQYHQWIAPPKKGKKDKKQEVLLQMNPSLNKHELELLSSMTSDDELKSMMYDLGYQEQDIKDTFGKG